MTTDPRALPDIPEASLYPSRFSDRKRRRGMVAVDMAAMQEQYERGRAWLSLYVLLRKYHAKLAGEGR